jgi:hypothetical protein
MGDPIDHNTAARLGDYLSQITTALSLAAGNEDLVRRQVDRLSELCRDIKSAGSAHRRLLVARHDGHEGAIVRASTQYRATVDRLQVERARRWGRTG